MEKKNGSHGLEWLWVGGCKLVVFLLLCGCSNLAWIHDEPGKSDAVVRENVPPPTPYPMPKNTNEESIEWLILSEKQPTAKELITCSQKISSLTPPKMDEKNFAEARKKVVPLVKMQKEIYHWCFFQKIHQLDVEINATNSSFDAQAHNFFKKMEELWILSKALDDALSQTLYFPFLREHYVQLSKEIFGRDLIIVGTPWFTPVGSKLKAINSTGKPLGEFK